MEAIIPDLNQVLAHINIGMTFWALNPTWLVAVPPAGTEEWWLWRAWGASREALAAWGSDHHPQGAPP